MNKKKIVLPIIILAAVCLAGVAVAFVVKHVNTDLVAVVSVDSLAQDCYYGDMSDSLSGQVTNHVTQKVQLQDEAVVSEVFVKAGDLVKTGDRLMSYDTTLMEMELELEKLIKQRNKKLLAEARKRLTSLETGGSVYETDLDPSVPSGGRTSGGEDDLAMTESRKGTSGLTAVTMFRPLFTNVAAISETSMETPGELPEAFTKAYDTLDFDAIPYDGIGTREEPFRFLCNIEVENIRVLGSFLNKMAGYDAAGSKKLSETPYWYRLEFHENNRVEDPDNPDESLKSYYFRQGDDAIHPETDVRSFPVKGAWEVTPTSTPTDTPTPTPTAPPTLTPTPAEDGDDEEGDFWDGDIADGYEEGGNDPNLTITREDAIKSQKSNIRSLELEIRNNDLKISKLEKQVENQIVTATIDGMVTVVGDPETGSSGSDAFLEVESANGLYIQGGISELLLEQVDVGQKLNVMSYETGANFQAEIREISQFPEESSYQYFMDMRNPNASYYSFMAVILGDADLNSDEGVSMTLVTDSEEGDDLNIEAAFVRTENGVDYVYKDENGRLKKQIVEATKSFDGYTITISSGLTREDKIAFPYGSNVKNGAKTKEGTLDEIYGYY